MKQSVSLTVNGRPVETAVAARLRHADFLRLELRLTATHLGCEHGVCGACTILMNGQSTRSCLTFAVMADGAEISTIEGLGTIDDMHPLQAAFWEKHGLQCGFCTPGMLMTALELLRENPDANKEEIREALSGNLCRCTGYQTIVEAVDSAAATMRGADQ